MSTLQELEQQKANAEETISDIKQQLVGSTIPARILTFSNLLTEAINDLEDINKQIKELTPAPSTPIPPEVPTEPAPLAPIQPEKKNSRKGIKK